MTKKLIDIDDNVWNYVKAYAELKNKKLVDALEEIIKGNNTIQSLMELNKIESE